VFSRACESVAMLDLKTSVAHLLTRVSSPFHCRQATGASRHHPNTCKVHPEPTGCKPRRLLRIGFVHHFSSVKSGGSNFRYEKVSYFVEWGCRTCVFLISDMRFYDSVL
jgi:hypothetical protein